MIPWLSSCKEFFFPSFCLGCGCQLANGKLPLFCQDCLRSVDYIFSPLCSCCGKPFLQGDDHLCGQCLKKTFYFDSARSLAVYKKPVSTLIHDLKFSGSLNGLGSIKSLVAGSFFCSSMKEPDYIFPIPLHAKRLKARGFNQAVMLAHCFFPFWKERIKSGLLIRHGDTAPQALLSKQERRQNVVGVFRLTQPEFIRGKRIILIDDVYTTGSTVNQCARVLRQAGASSIEVFTLARAV